MCSKSNLFDRNIQKIDAKKTLIFFALMLKQCKPFGKLLLFNKKVSVVEADRTMCNSHYVTMLIMTSQILKFWILQKYNNLDISRTKHKN